MACNLRRCFRAAAFLTVCLSCTALAKQSEQADVSAVEPTPVLVDEADVDLALIEFLGQWETDDGEWIAPSDLADETFVELIEAVGSLEIEEID